MTTDLQYGNRVMTTHLGRDFVASEMLDAEWIERVKPIVIWRDVMSIRPVQASREQVILGESYKDSLQDSHDLIYSNNTCKVFLRRNN